MPLFDFNNIASACSVCCFLKEFRKEVIDMINFIYSGELFVALWHPYGNLDKLGGVISEQDSNHK